MEYLRSLSCATYKAALDIGNLNKSVFRIHNVDRSLGTFEESPSKAYQKGLIKLVS